MNARTKVGDLFKDKIKSYELKGDLKSKVAPEKQLFRPLLNRNLGWNEIQKLIQGKPVFKVTINSRYIDRNFGTENCYRAVNESINSKVKRHMTEAIKSKRKDVMVESILKDIKGLRK
jgi:hemolysin activation/secretion protein